MMKSLILFFFISFVTFGQEKTRENTNQHANSDSTVLLKSNEIAHSKDFEKLGFELMESETLNKLKLGIQDSDLATILGLPDDTTKNELWGADGLYHQTYKYSKLGIKLDLIGETKSDKVINMITAINPCPFKTSKGISIGSNYQKVEQAYKDYLNSNFSNAETLVAGSIYGGVIFSFENGEVKSIFIGASAE
ncbi:hypothetical protein [Saccharicrinis sp. FJH54]|uniref:hypothetical protein n=1 Tax=Saccharicrinis sp. FJH54 TaxID=3344665 RepID=UPI0035D44A89